MIIEIPMDEFEFERASLAAQREGKTLSDVIDFVFREGSPYLFGAHEVAPTSAGRTETDRQNSDAAEGGDA